MAHKPTVTRRSAAKKPTSKKPKISKSKVQQSQVDEVPKHKGLPPIISAAVPPHTLILGTFLGKDSREAGIKITIYLH